MNRPETFDIDAYPWSAPTEEQKAWFEALSPAARREAVAMAIEEGFCAPLSDRSMKEIAAFARTRLPDTP